MPTDSPSFANLRVAALESRRADDIARLIEKFGGRPFVSPSMREVPIEQNREAIDFAHRLITGQVDVVIFLTGVGFKHLLTAVEPRGASAACAGRRSRDRCWSPTGRSTPPSSRTASPG